jgi:mannose-1-phosphate guanylyltransferase
MNHGLGPKKGVILAGGQGKRLRPLSYYFQKCMIPVGSQQKPLLEYVIRLLAHHHINDVTILVGYKHEQIMNYFNSGDRFHVNISYLPDSEDLKGSGGSILNLYRQGELDPNDTLIIYYGDILSNINLSNMVNQHQDENATATLALSQGYQIRVGVAKVKGKHIVGWAEKPTLDIYAGIGVLALDASALQEFERLSQNTHQTEFDIMSDFIPHLIREGMTVQSYITKAFWYDVGSIERYEKIENNVIEHALGGL